MKKENTDERKGLPSGSSIGQLIACPGSFQLAKISEPPPADEWAASGSRIAALINAIETGGQIPNDLGETEEELDTAKFLADKKATMFGTICAENQLDPGEFEMFHERRLWFDYKGESVMSGKLDTYGVHKTLPIAIILDDKSGWREQPPPELNWQLRAYALLVWQNHEQLQTKKVTIIVATVSRFWDVSATFETATNKPTSLSYLFTEIGQACYYAKHSRPFELGLMPGEQCRYCPAILNCPAIKHELVDVERDFTPIPFEGKIQALTDSKLELLLDSIEVVSKLDKAARKEAEKRLLENPEAFDKWCLKSGPPRRGVTDLWRAISAVIDSCPGMSLKEVIECMRSDALAIGSTSKLEKLLYAKANLFDKATHKDVDAAMIEIFEKSGVFETKEPDPKLTRK